MMQKMMLRTFVLDLLRRSGEIALQYFRTDMGVENKAVGGGYDPVTAADRAIETLLREAIVAAYPEHGILAEEFGDLRPEARCQWFIDPIDGTRAFMSGSPLWGTLIGLAEDNVPVLGALSQPFTGEIFFAAESRGELIRGEQCVPLRARATAALADAVLYSTDPDMFMGQAGDDARFRALSEQVLLRRFGGDCYSYAMLAAGYIDLVVEAGLNAYDIVPLIPILESAGAVVTDWRGQPALQGGRIVAAANPGLHAQALAVLGA